MCDNVVPEENTCVGGLSQGSWGEAGAMSERLNPVLLNILSVSADLTHGVTTSSNSKFYPFPSGEENIEKVIWAHQKR